MDRFLIITNASKDLGSELSKKVEAKIAEASKSVVRFMFNDVWTLIDQNGKKAVIPEDIECALVVGGDGTMLHAEHELYELNIPMVGINMGTVGYLADINAASWDEAIDELIKKSPVTEERMMLLGTIKRGDSIIYRDVALNDIVLGRKSSLHSIDIDVHVDGQLIKSYLADGMIVSTPTGSTAYNLSAGGPIAIPTSSLMLITPVAPHVLINRSLVVSEDTEVILQLTEKRSGPGLGEAAIYFDGREYIMEPDDLVEIVKAPKKARLFKMSNLRFLENLSSKMTEGEARI